MKLTDKITEKTIISLIQSEDKSHTIQELLNKLLDLEYLTSTTKLFSFIENHDKIMNPAVGRGIALHHSSSIEVDEMVAVFGISHKGIDYESPDKQRVHFILLILDPIDEPTLHRKFIHKFQKFINDHNIKTQLLDCQFNQDIVMVMSKWEKEYLLNE
tara:strand:+ start:923 stop:1396 length:474 start_codon:yes stop_codon:yes gene_type:complete